MLSYVWRDLVRNPRRTLSSIVGVTLGVGLFSGVLFFIDGSQATMTTRSLASLAVDIQAVLSSPLGRDLRLQERIVAPDALAEGDRAKVILTVINDAAVPANEVVVNDEPPTPLAYVRGTTTLNGESLRDKGSRSPLSQGLARSGLNIGTVPPGATLRLTYIARATRPIASVKDLPSKGTISSREDVVPAPANPPPQPTLRQLEEEIKAIPGVAGVDGLSFVDLPSESLRRGASAHARAAGDPPAVRSRVRIFAFDQGYQERYPSIRIAEGAFAPGSALLSAEASRALSATPGQTITLRLPSPRNPLSLPVSGVVDLSRAKPLFYSRKSNKLEDFLYVRNAVVVTPTMFEQRIIPAFRVARATRGRLVKALPVQEVDVLVDRLRLHSDPSSALVQTKSIARSINRIAPDQVYLIDNISNALQVARDDADVGKRMFLFLGLPGALLAGFLAAYAGSVLAATQRREQAILRVRGADRSRLDRMLVWRTAALAGLGSVLGSGLGFLTAVFALPPGTLWQVPAGDFVMSALIAIGVGIITTGLGFYLPQRRSLSREVRQEHSELAIASAPAWRRSRLDFAFLAAAAVAEGTAFAAGAFDPPTASVTEGQAVAFPSRLLPAPLIAWIGGVLFSARIIVAIMSRLPPPSPRFGRVVSATLERSVRRRSWSAAAGIICVGLVVALGMSLALFTATYDAAKSADSRFVVGSDLRVTPSVLSSRSHPPSYSSKLEVPGVSGVTPVVFKPENAVLIGANNQDRADLTAIDPESFRRVAVLSDAFFVDRSADRAMAELRADPRGVLVDQEKADDLGISTGDRVQILLARGTRHQRLKTFRVIGLFMNFPGFPQHTSLVVNLHYYEAATGLRRADFFLARVSDQSHAGLARAITALRSGPGKNEPLNIESRETALDKDQSSLTALNVHGLSTLNWLYTLLTGAASLAIFVFGLMLQRHKEYATLRALGLGTLELGVLVCGEAALVALCGLGAGVLVGTAMGYLSVHILRALFILDPSVTFAAGGFATLAVVVTGATLASALGAAVILRRLRPTELLRDT
jgi:putative ABC transport system permease protein